MLLLLMAAAPAATQPFMVPEGLPMPSEFGPYPDDCRDLMQPYARDPRVYGGIYLAVEQVYVPIAKYFFPVLQVITDDKNWVRITRTTRGGAKPPDHLTVFGNNHNLRGEPASVPVIMKIDKCSGAILEMSFDRDKVR